MVDKAINEQDQCLVWFADPSSEHRKFSRTWCLNHCHQSEGKNTVTFCELNEKCLLTDILEDSEHFRPATVLVSQEVDFVDVLENKIETSTF